MLKEGENAAAQLLFNAGVTVERFESAGMQSSGGEKGTNSENEALAEDGDNAEGESQTNNRGRNGKNVKTPTVNAFGRDLTNLARQGKLDPVIGRKEELKRVVQIL
jgi:ATP-dependent Clp protease ATP-binding subunit ClpC